MRPVIATHIRLYDACKPSMQQIEGDTCVTCGAVFEEEGGFVAFLHNPESAFPQRVSQVAPVIGTMSDVILQGWDFVHW